VVSDKSIDYIDYFLKKLDAKTHPIALPDRDMTSQPGSSIYASCLMLNSGILFKPNGITLCCWIPTFLSYDELPEESITPLQLLKNRILSDIASGHKSYCSYCPYLEKKKWSNSDKITFLSFGHTTSCNLDCTYCQARGRDSSDKSREVFSIVKQMCSEGIAYPDSFDWGGNGEPTLDPDFENILSYISMLGAKGTIYTNSVKFSPSIQNGIEQGKLSIITSVDAGSPETYEKIRRRDFYDKFWNTISAYLKSGREENINVKFIVTEENCSQKDLIGFIDKCKKTRVKKVLLSRDMHSEIVSDRILEALAWLGSQCQKNDISFSFLDGVIGEKSMGQIKKIMEHLT